MKEDQKKYGIALSGGGARGIAHLGVLAALEEHGIYPEVISGTSMGSVVGMFYAYGMPPKEILSLIKEYTNFKTMIDHLNLQSIVKSNPAFDAMKNYIPEDDFSVLKKKFFVAVANLNLAKNEIRSSGKMFQFIIASCSIPVLFPAQEIDGNTYVDGGLFNNLPAESLIDECDYIIGSHVNHNAEKQEFHGKKEIAERCFQLTIAQNVEKSKQFCDLLIEPPEARNYKTFDFKCADEIFNVGYVEACRVLSELCAIGKK